GRADGEGPPDGFRIQGDSRQADGHRPERAGDRPRPATGRRDERTCGFDGDDLRRQGPRHDDRTGAVSPRVRVAVLAGGRSSEHEISVASARSVLESLDPYRYEAVTVEIDREGKWQLDSGEARATDPPAAGQPDVA